MPMLLVMLMSALLTWAAAVAALSETTQQARRVSISRWSVWIMTMRHITHIYACLLGRCHIRMTSVVPWSTRHSIRPLSMMLSVCTSTTWPVTMTVSPETSPQHWACPLPLNHTLVLDTIYYVLLLLSWSICYEFDLQLYNRQTTVTQDSTVSEKKLWCNVIMFVSSK